MKGYEPTLSFGPDAAAVYDRITNRGDEAETVAFLAEAARGGPALELAIGTGRIGLPLAARGVTVDGIELSPPMVEQLRAKPGGDALEVTIGDFADVGVDGRYRLIYVVFNTFFNLLSQDDQVRCFENVAAHLTGDWVFVIEGLTPSSLHRLRDDQYVNTEHVGVDVVGLDLLRHDAATQTLEESHVLISAKGISLNPVVQRYAWPHEMDLMARIAGLRLHERWATWTREPFVSDSKNVISVWGH